MQVLAGAHDFYGKEMSAFAVDVWMLACESFDVEQVTKALSAHLMDPERGQWMPKPADLVRQLEGTQTDRSLVAWGKLYQAMQRVGAYTSVTFDDQAIHATVQDMGGWPTLCRSTVDELPFIQKRFCETYRAYVRRPDAPYPPVLIGVHESENRAAGKRVAPPVLIGDKDKAGAVYLGGTNTRLQITTATQALERV